MPKQTIVFEIDTTNLTPEITESFKNGLAKKMFDAAFSDSLTNAFLVQAEHNKHDKVKIDFSTGKNPSIIFNYQDLDTDKLKNIE
jgi:hypothetical protein